jgi:DNA-binding NtrC family response regulator
VTRGRPSVLLVEDDRATLEGLAKLLASWDYQVRTAAEGGSALEICESALPHAVVTDLMMPGMDGIAFLKRLGPRTGQVAVILLTGHATIETAVQAIKLGAYDYLTKPVQASKRCWRRD